MIAAVILAWDGVLVETEPACFQVIGKLLGEVCEREGLAITPDAIRGALQATSGRTVPDSLAVCCQRLAVRTSAAPTAETCEARLQVPYLATPLIPGARDIVLRLQPHCRVAVASLSPSRLVNGLIDRHDMRVLFDAVVTLEDAALPPVERYREAAQRLQVTPESCIVVEGTALGVQAARAVGMRCIAIPRRARHGDDFGAANRVVRSLGDLTLEFLDDVDRVPGPAEQGRPAALYARCYPHARAADLLHLQAGATSALARDRGWQVVASFEDVHEGNRWADRPGLQQVMQLARSGHIQRVVVTEPSVLAPGASDQAEVIRALADHDTRVQTVFRRSPMSGPSVA